MKEKYRERRNYAFLSSLHLQEALDKHFVGSTEFTSSARLSCSLSLLMKQDRRVRRCYRRWWTSRKK